MANPFLGEIRPVGFNFAPQGWALCNGQILPIQQYTALFSLLFTTFGGNGTQTFALPNLQGAVPLGAGQGIGLSPYALGQQGGSSTVALDVNEMPQHLHQVAASRVAATEHSAVGQVPALSTREVYATTGSQLAAQTTVQNVGEGLAHNNMQPYQVVTFIIALVGIYPPRS